MVTIASIRPFDDATLAAVAKAVGDLYSGAELTHVLAAAKLADPDGEGTTKWRRLYNAVAAHQNRHGNGKATVALIKTAMEPARTLDRIGKAASVRDALNQVLSLSGLGVRKDGQVHRAFRAQTDTEAHARAARLRSHLEDRGVHAVVLSGLKDEWLRTDYYDAVFESIKLLGHRLRSMTRLDLDGYQLVDAALLGAKPPVLLNAYSTETEKNEQRGVASLAQGLFSAMRNPQAHQPRTVWTMSEQDALDVFGILSLIHRRLDGASHSIQPARSADSC